MSVEATDATYPKSTSIYFDDFMIIFKIQYSCKINSLNAKVLII